MEIKISAKAFAQFIVGGPSKKAQIVTNIRKPQSIEAKAISHYYSKAVDVIRIYHTKGNDQAYLAEQLRSLGNKMETSESPWARAKFRHNIRVIHGYVDLYGSKNRKVLPRPRLSYSTDGVRVTASPDIAIEEDGRRFFIKLGPTKRQEHPEAVRIMLRLIFVAATSRFKLEPSDVTYLDLANAARLTGNQADISLMSTINSACKSLAAMC